ncbi:MAG: hypothetical protein RL404_1982 [Pseudomonadota bacterium]
MNNEVTASFGVDTEHLHKLGAVDPYSKQSLELYASGKLVSNERLYFTLWGCSELNMSLIEPNTRLCAAGTPAESAYFIVSGTALGLQGQHIYRLGPGSVIGLAEGIAGVDYVMTVIAVTPVQVRLLPMGSINLLIQNMPSGLKGIVRSLVMRTLKLPQPTPQLL